MIKAVHIGYVDKGGDPTVYIVGVIDEYQLMCAMANEADQVGLKLRPVHRDQLRIPRTRLPLFDPPKAPTEELKYAEHDNQPTIASGVYERSAGKWK